MKPNCNYLFVVLIVCLLSLPTDASAQQLWASWSHKIPTKGYEGKRFRLESQVRSEGSFDGSSARLWARVDNPRNDGFFDNMAETPVQDMNWKSYSIEGIIDPSATQLMVGPLLTSAGKFYFDNFKVEIETEKDKWTTVFADDFEIDLSKWEAGNGIGLTGTSEAYNASLVTDKSSKSRVLYIEGNK